MNADRETCPDCHGTGTERFNVYAADVPHVDRPCWGCGGVGSVPVVPSVDEAIDRLLKKLAA